MANVVAHARGEGRLADATRTHEHDAPASRTRKCGDRLVHLSLPANEAHRRSWHIGHAACSRLIGEQAGWPLKDHGRLVVAITQEHKLARLERGGLVRGQARRHGAHGRLRHVERLLHGLAHAQCEIELAGEGDRRRIEHERLRTHAHHMRHARAHKRHRRRLRMARAHKDQAARALCVASEARVREQLRAKRVSRAAAVLEGYRALLAVTRPVQDARTHRHHRPQRVCCCRFEAHAYLAFSFTQCLEELLTLRLEREHRQGMRAPIGATRNERRRLQHREVREWRLALRRRRSNKWLAA